MYLYCLMQIIQVLRIDLVLQLVCLGEKQKNKSSSSLFLSQIVSNISIVLFAYMTLVVMMCVNIKIYFTICEKWNNFNKAGTI